MFLKRLSVHGLRNLKDVDVTLSSGANFFYGANGSGKTSILEAVYLLSRGRSFKQRNLRAVINHHSQECTCYGGLDDGGVESSIGVTRTRGGAFTFKVAGDFVKSASRLAETLPLLLINNESFLLLEGGPAFRRSFLDWGVFHVEHRYRALWARFQRCLKHRNSLLRRARIDPLQLSVWDAEFIQLAQEITRYREQYLSDFLPVLNAVIERLKIQNEWAFKYSPGWDTESSLEQLLIDSLERDQKAGYTQLGPHRADLKIQISGRKAVDVLSRGQTKILVTALKIAQGFLYRELCKKQCVYLLDDLPSELDKWHRISVAEALQELGSQLLITGIDKNDLLESWPGGLQAEMSKGVAKMFHVEHGKVANV